MEDAVLLEKLPGVEEEGEKENYESRKPLEYVAPQKKIITVREDRGGRVYDSFSS